ncbi:MAG: N-acetylneuraminate synthase family protein [Spirochaetia bacterium]|nr:N-acetylneuraminate synthase family protein [Spirochaetia bacterium]
MPERFFASEIVSEKTQKSISLKSQPYLTAEIGLNHNNDIELAQKLIREAAKAGADGVKFQSYTTDLFINKNEPKIKELYQIFQKYELSKEAHSILQKTAHDEGIDFFSTPLSIDWVKNLNELNVPFFKIASGDINNFQLILEILKTNKPVIISTGAASLDEIEKTSALCRLWPNINAVFLHCVSMYPVEKKSLNLINIAYLSERLNALTGFSDHSIGYEAAFAAVSTGAVFIEKHFTFDKNLPGPDHKLSADPSELKILREKINMAHDMRGELKKSALPEETKADFFGKRSLYNIDGKLTAMRPRQEHLPKDSDFLIFKINQD